MNSFLECAGVFLLGLGGALAGWRFSRLRSRCWFLGFAIPFTLVLMIGAARRDVRLEFIRPFSWLVAGWREFVLMAPITTMLLFTPLMRLKRPRTRVIVAVFAVGLMFYASVLPFLSPAMVRGELAQLKTQIDPQGVCRQQTGYTCGPAAAVTGLRRLGFVAEEGDLAIAMRTCPALGTQSDVMTEVLAQTLGPRGLRCEYRAFRSVAELPRDTPTLAVIRYGVMVDHFIAILEVSDDRITVGDPLHGIKTYSHADFAKIWRFAGIVLRGQGS